MFTPKLPCAASAAAACSEDDMRTEKVFFADTVVVTAVTIKGGGCHCWSGFVTTVISRLFFLGFFLSRSCLHSRSSSLSRSLCCGSSLTLHVWSPRAALLSPCSCLCSSVSALCVSAALSLCASMFDRSVSTACRSPDCSLYLDAACENPPGFSASACPQAHPGPVQPQSSRRLPRCPG